VLAVFGVGMGHCVILRMELVNRARVALR
jgi:hypothetical protein